MEVEEEVDATVVMGCTTIISLSLLTFLHSHEMVFTVATYDYRGTQDHRNGVWDWS